MSSTTASHPKKLSKVTLRVLQEEIESLRARVEDLEDLRELNDAISRNGKKPLIRWNDAKKQLGL
jgi:hypothetical protein